MCWPICWSLALLASAQAQILTVRSVTLLKTSGQPQIEVKTSGPVSPATQAVTGPDRIVIDFPGALPAETLRKLSVHRGGLQRVRAGLFQSQPPITRIVLDVDGPTDYQVVPSGNSIVIKLGPPEVAANSTAKPEVAKAPSTQPRVQQEQAREPVKLALVAPMPSPAAFRARQAPGSIPALQVVNTVNPGRQSGFPALVSSVVTAPVVVPPVAQETASASPPRPKVDVGVRSNLLSIKAQGATLAEVLYEVHRRTGADIAIPAGAEQERVVVNIPPAPGRDVIASLLNGSRFNYIVLGSDADPGGFRNILLSLKEGGGSSGMFVQNLPASGTITPAQPRPLPSNLDPVAEQAQMDPGGITQSAPELEPIPDDTPPAEPETNADNPRQAPPQQVPIQTIPDAGQIPQ